LRAYLPYSQVESLTTRELCRFDGLATLAHCVAEPNVPFERYRDSGFGQVATVVGEVVSEHGDRAALRRMTCAQVVGQDTTAAAVRVGFEFSSVLKREQKKEIESLTVSQMFGLLNDRPSSLEQFVRVCESLAQVGVESKELIQSLFTWVKQEQLILGQSSTDVDPSHGTFKSEWGNLSHLIGESIYGNYVAAAIPGFDDEMKPILDLFHSALRVEFADSQQGMSYAFESVSSDLDTAIDLIRHNIQEATARPPEVPSARPVESAGDVSAQLEKLTGLHAAGALTPDEFAAAKKRLLGLD